MKLGHLLRALVDYRPNDKPARLARMADVVGLQSRRLEERRVLVAPTLVAGGATASFTEGGAAVAIDPTIDVDDSDSAQLVSASVQITANRLSTDELVFVNQSGIVGVYSSITGTLTLTGSATVAKYQDALQSITFRNNSDAPGALTRTVAFTVNDGAANSNVVTTDVNVTPIANTPTISDAIVNEDQQTTSGLVITADPDDPDATHYKVTGIANGTLYQNDGITNIANGSFITVAEGAAGLKFTPTANYFGNTSITVQASKSANDAGLGGNTVQADIIVSPVADNPTVPNTTINEGSVATGLQVLRNAVDGTSVTHFKITNITNGTLAYFNGIGFTNISDGDFVTLARAMNLRFTPSSTSFSGVGGFDAQASTSGNNGGLGGTPQTGVINVTAINDAPILNVPGAQSVDEDDPAIVFAGGNLISVTDDSTSGTLIVDITTSNGNFKLNSGAVGNVTFLLGTTDDSKHLRFEGTLAQINAALNGSTYDSDPNFSGSDSIAIEVDDQGNTGGGSLTDMATIAVTVDPINDAPVLTVPATISFNEDAAPFSFTGGNLISVADDATSGNLIVEITATNGRVRLNPGAVGNVTFLSGTSDNSKNLRFRGTLAQINAALDGATYDSDLNFTGSDSIAIEVDDQGNTGSGPDRTDSETIGVTVNAVNDAPVITAPAAANVSEDGTLTFTGINQLSIGDVDDTNGSQMLEVSITAINGIFSLSQTTGLTLMSGAFDSAFMVVTGSRANLNAALDDATFEPTAGFMGAASVAINADDLGNTGNGGALADNKVVAITVAAVNDPPVITVPGALQSVAEDSATGLIFSSGNGNQISVADDATSGQIIVKLTAGDGLITLQGDLTGITFLNGNLNGEAQVEFRGTLGQINAALSTVRYDPDADFTGSDTIDVEVDDQGNTGSGGDLTDTATININVGAANDAPVITVPAAQIINEDAPPISFNGGNLISIADDATSGTLIVEIVTTNGNFRLNPAAMAGVTFLGGTTDDSKLLRFEGTLAQINAALNGSTYDSDSDFNGADLISISVDDQGNTGLGTPQSDLKTIAVTVNAVNDAPLITAPGATQNVGEDSAIGLIFSASNGNQISVADDATSGQITVKLTASNGLVTIQGSLTGLTFLNGNVNGTSVVEFSGTLSEINAALSTVRYDANLNFNGADTIVVDVNDQGNTGSGGALTDSETINITVDPVNDAPTIIVPGIQVVNEDAAPISFSGANLISITDDATSGTLIVDITTVNGVVQLNPGAVAGVTFLNSTTDNSKHLRFEGTLAQINAALSGSTYDSDTDFNGADLISITVDDQGNTGVGTAETDAKAIAVVINPVNDGPSVSADLIQATDEGQAIVFSGLNGISIVDIDSGSLNVSISIVPTTPHAAGAKFLLGSLPASLIVNGNGTTLVTLSGSLSDINAALAGGQLIAGDDGTLLVTLSVDDGFILANPVMTVVVSNVAPNITLPSGQNLLEGQVAIFNAVIGDFDFEPFTQTGVDINWTVTRGGSVVSAGVGPMVNFFPTNDGTFTLSGSALDKDGGMSAFSLNMVVKNVAPVVDFVDALPVNTLRTTFITLNVSDPGADDITVTYLWGDPVRPSDVVTYVFSGGTMRVLGPQSHEYIVAPNPANPLANIPITVIVSDGVDSVSQTFEIEVTGRGLPSGNPIPIAEIAEIRIVENDFNDARQEIDSVTQPVTQPVDTDVARDDGGESEPRRLVLRIVTADGESEDFALPEEALADLPKYFRVKRFPDGHYRVYLIQGGTARLVIDTYIRQGKLVDPGDETDAQADRPPAQEDPAPKTQTPHNGIEGDQPAHDSVLPDGSGGPRFQSTWLDQERSGVRRNSDFEQMSIVGFEDVELANEAEQGFRSTREIRQAALARTLLTGALMAGAVTAGRRSWAEQVDESLATQRPALGKLARVRRRMTQPIK